MNLFEKSQELEDIINKKNTSKLTSQVNKIQHNFEKFKFKLTKLLWVSEDIPIYFRYEHPKTNIVDDDKVQVLYCIDGDTFVGMQNGQKKSFRLSAINTPEKGFLWSKESTLLLAHLIDKKTVYLNTFGRDKYDRKIVDVFLDPERKICVNDVMIKEGMTKYQNYDSVNKFKTHNFIQNMCKMYYYLNAYSQGKGIWGNQEDFYSNMPSKLGKRKKL